MLMKKFLTLILGMILVAGIMAVDDPLPTLNTDECHVSVELEADEVTSYDVTIDQAWEYNLEVDTGPVEFEDATPLYIITLDQVHYDYSTTGNSFNSLDPPIYTYTYLGSFKTEANFCYLNNRLDFNLELS